MYYRATTLPTTIPTTECLALHWALPIKRTIGNILSALPAKYGSDAWWDKEEQKSRKDYKEGRFKTYNSVQALMKDLN